MRPLLPKRSYTWAPKALAVVSFALAMLAMQPMVDAGTAEGSYTVIVKEVSGSLPAVARQTPAKATPTPRSWLLSDSGPTTTRLHILATVEILHRLLISQLHVQPTELYFSYLPSFDQICVAVLPPATAIRFALPAQCHACPPPAERTFAITRLLLAPPMV